VLTVTEPNSLKPQAWCQSILAPLTSRTSGSREARYLEMLLRYLSQVNPTAEEFPSLLAQYVADPRPSTVEAAKLLQRLWLSDCSARDLLRLSSPLQDTLRAFGALLDDAGARAGYALVEPTQAELRTFGELAPLELGPLGVKQVIAARTALRGQVAAADPARLGRHETHLRAVGAALDLDRDPDQSYEVIVLPRAIMVESSAGKCLTFTHEQLAALLQTSAYLR
jgi:hypothetical protein